ncbi:MAG: hypothetical protein WCD28_09070 [Nitrososphaeraceae archaeon]|jgi:hypothetical protein
MNVLRFVRMTMTGSEEITGLNNNDKHLSVIEGEIKNTRTWFRSQKYIFVGLEKSISTLLTIL